MAIQRLSAGYAREGMAPLAGCTPEALARETLANAAQWSFLAKVDALTSRPALVVTSDDAFAAALRAAGDSRVTTLDLPTDHSYSDQCTELANAVDRWLETLP